MPPGRWGLIGAGAAAVIMLTVAVWVVIDGDDATETHSTEHPATTAVPTASSEPAAATTTTQPPATPETLEQVGDIIRDVLQRRDALLVTLNQMPTIVSNPDAPELAAFRALHTPDSPLVQRRLSSLQQLVASGEAYRPGPSGILARTTSTPLEAIDLDTMRFAFCTYSDFERVNVASGVVVQAGAEMIVGDGIARRIDGTWRIHEGGVSVGPDDVTTFPPGSPFPCPESA